MNKVIKNIIKNHIAKTISGIDIARFSQEPAYVNAVLAKIDGLVYKGANGYVELRSTVVNDRGPNSAESVYGADFAITARIETDSQRIEKAVIGQAKKGRIENLDRSEYDRLITQVNKMKSTTTAHVVLEVPEIKGMPAKIRLPYQKHSNSEKFKYPIKLEDYIADHLIECLHGDTRDKFVSAVAESSLSKLSVLIKI